MTNVSKKFGEFQTKFGTCEGRDCRNRAQVFLSLVGGLLRAYCPACVKKVRARLRRVLSRGNHEF